jgi:hypothetical protein
VVVKFQAIKDLEASKLEGGEALLVIIIITALDPFACGFAIIDTRQLVVEC